MTRGSLLAGHWTSTGSGAAWLACLLWEQEVAGSNPAFPTNQATLQPPDRRRPTEGRLFPTNSNRSRQPHHHSHTTHTIYTHTALDMGRVC